jgi:hypothetical protein
MPCGGYASVMRWLFDGYAEIMQVGLEDGLLPHQPVRFTWGATKAPALESLEPCFTSQSSAIRLSVRCQAGRIDVR